MKFDFCIGNPPYQVQNAAGTTDGNRSMPVYHTFMEAAYGIADKTMLITPARFLFDAGKTPKDFNQRMLHDKHFKVIKYWPDSADVFGGVDIKGGVSVTYRDTTREYKEIGVMLPFVELVEIVDKVQDNDGFMPFSHLFRPKYSYHFVQDMYDEKPELVGCMSKEHKYDMESNVFDLMPGAFENEKTEGEEYACIHGRTNNQRVKKYLPERYISYPDNYGYYKVMVPISNGSGAYGETLSTPFVANPKEGNTVTFLSIGAFATENEANRCLKYLKTKFFRALLGGLKITQHNPASVWALIPNQDYSSLSDINWNLPLKTIDQQLYKKYGLSDEEIRFIETHVKEMA